MSDDIEQDIEYTPFSNVTVEELKVVLERNEHSIVLDSRKLEHFHHERVPNSISTLENCLYNIAEKVHFNQAIYVICYHGIKSESVAEFLVAQGLTNVHNVLGGFHEWKESGYPTESDSAPNDFENLLASNLKTQITPCAGMVKTASEQLAPLKSNTPVETKACATSNSSKLKPALVEPKSSNNEQILSFLFRNFYDKSYYSVEAQAAFKSIKNGAPLLDIRSKAHFDKEAPLSAMHFTMDNFNEIVAKLNKKRPIYIICYRGLSSRKVAEYLVTLGFDFVCNINGGIHSWIEAGLPTTANKN